VAHAGWNVLLKTSANKIAFLWLLASTSFVVFLTPAIIFAASDGIGWKGAAFGIVSGLLHGAYGVMLVRGYQLGDLSVVYPIARGMGPALVPPIAVVLLGESVSPAASAGIGFVVLGVVVVQMEAVHPRELLAPARFLARPETGVALITGALITTYTVWDKASLEHLAPITLNQFSMLGYVVLLAPVVLAGRREALAAEWDLNRRNALAAGVLAPSGYILVLVALTSSHVSYVAPAREVGIIIGALIGVLLLREGYGRYRLLGSMLILSGVLVLGLAP
jgi:drug/metabolite transporter (DMT)-like permease